MTPLKEKPRKGSRVRRAVVAINGDYFGFRDTGIVIRNGVVFRVDGARQGLAF